MANYDIIGGIVDPKAFQELENFKKIVSEIGTIMQKSNLTSLVSTQQAAQFQQITLQNEKLRVQVDNLRIAHEKRTAKAQEQANKEIGYINQLEAEVKQLTQAYAMLNKEELGGASGAAALQNLKNKREELQGLKAAYGDMRMNVGNYSSATKMLGINIGQVLKEMPNFAISMRTGIMSLTNNLPMLAETIKQVRVEQLAMIEAGKKAPSMFNLIARSVFGLTGFMSALMVVLQIFGEDIIKWAGKMLKATDAAKDMAKAIADINSEANKSMIGKLEEIRKFALDYKKAYQEGDKEKIKNLEEYGKKEYNLNEQRLKMIRDTTLGWKTAFEDYLEIAKTTYYNEAIIKKQVEAQMSAESSLFKAQKLFLSKSNTGYFSGQIQVYNTGGSTSKMNWEQIVKLAYDGSFAQGVQEALFIHGVPQDIIDELRNIALQNKIIKDLPKLKKMPEGAFFSDWNNKENKKGNGKEKFNPFLGALNPDMDINTALEKMRKFAMDAINEQDKIYKFQEKVGKDVYDKVQKRIEDELKAKKEVYDKEQKRIEDELKAKKEVYDNAQKRLADELKAIKEQYDIQMQIEENSKEVILESQNQLVADIVDIWSVYYEWQSKKIDENLEKQTKFNDEKIRQYEDETEAGKHTQQELSEYKDRIADYQQSQEEEAARKRMELEKQQFIFNQLKAVADIWIQYAINMQKGGLNAAAQAWYLTQAISGSALAMAQTIPYFEEGGVMEKSGLAVVGEKRHEFGINPDGSFFITPDKPTLMQLQKGTQILPDANKIDLNSIIALKQIGFNSENNMMVYEMRKITNAIKSQKQGNFYGMPLIKQLERSEKLALRQKSLLN